MCCTISFFLIIWVAIAIAQYKVYIGTDSSHLNKTTHIDHLLIRIYLK